jgi:antitoxin MazE
MSEAIIGKWGKSLAVRLPGDIAKAARIGAGERVEIIAEEGDIVIRRAPPRYTLEELFRSKSPKEWRRLYAKVFDWGPDVGREIIEE